MSNKMKRLQLAADIAQLDLDIEMARNLIETFQLERNEKFRKLMSMGDDDA